MIFMYRAGLLILSTALIYNLFQYQHNTIPNRSLLHETTTTTTKANNNNKASKTKTTNRILVNKNKNDIIKLSVGISGEPSYKNICKQIQKRYNNNKNRKRKRMILQENKGICRNEQQSFQSLLQMYISVFLSKTTESFTNIDLGIVYQHTCNQWDVTCGLDTNTVQGLLPTPLQIHSIPNSSKMNDKVVLDLCHASIHNRTFGVDEILRYNNQEIWNVILPWMSDDLNHMLGENRIQPSTTTKKIPRSEVAMVYLSCLEEGGGVCQSYALPLYVYPLLIPSSIAFIDVITTPSCASDTSCFGHVNDLHLFLQHMFPRAVVTTDTMDSTWIVYMRILNADYFLSPPSESSLLAALSRRRHQKKQTMLVLHPLYLHWFPNILSLKCCAMVPFSFVKNTNTKELMHQLRLIPVKPRYCPSIRGKIGSWVENLSLAVSLQYKEKLHHYLGQADLNFLPSPNSAYRPPTTFQWVDDWSPQCPPLSPFTKESFCKTMLQQNVTRIFFIGDYTSLNQAMSLWMMLGNSYQVKDDSNWNLDMICPGGTTFTVEFVRNEKMVENDTPISPGHPNCGDRYCYPWKERYATQNHKHFNKKTILVVNFGLFISTINEYRRTLKTFLKKELSIISKQDYVFFRLSVPGHDHCDTTQHPYSNYTHYNSSIPPHPTTRWDFLPVYNNIVHQELHKIHFKHKFIVPLNVYDTTVLRPDGHVSGLDCKDCGDVQDCLHYSLPGVVDWWNLIMVRDFMDWTWVASPS